jgi:signal transduction histidine kinase
LLSRIEESIRQINPVSELMTHQINADVASYLHNSLQSQLLAIAGQMEISAQNLDEDEFRKNFDLLKVSLENPLRKDFSHFMNNPLPRLNRLERAWRGIANVKITIGEEVLQDHNRNILIAQLIEESIANAVRHSNAKTILVSAQLVQGGRVQLTVQNDGASTPTTNNGIGTAWLDHFAPNSWNRIHSELGTQLDITLS